METVITRDTDVIREYLAALDSRERAASPFARLAATVKLARLRDELRLVHLEATDEDFDMLRRETEERLTRTSLRRFLSRTWGARLSVFLMIVLGQQLALTAIWLITRMFARFAPTTRGWNPLLPHEHPGSLFAFVFLFFLLTPFLALCVVFGGRFFSAWKMTFPATLALLIVCGAATYLVGRGKTNPVSLLPSITKFSQDRGGLQNYHEWVELNWLMRDPRFQSDYEDYLRNGPGRWITSQLEGKGDRAWDESLQIFTAYLEQGKDEEGFREWLSYYLDRNKIYSSDRIPQEVDTMTRDTRELGIWQVEPFLKERDRRLYQSYLGSIDTSMKRWGLILLALWVLIFIIVFIGRQLIAKLTTKKPTEADLEGTSPQSTTVYRFPEMDSLSTPVFYDTPLRIFSHVHRSFLRLAVFSCVLVFLFWGVVYSIDLTSSKPNPASQDQLMRRNILFLPEGERELRRVDSAQASQPRPYATIAALRAPGTETRSENDTPVAGRFSSIERRLEEEDYQRNRRFKEQAVVLLSQGREIDLIKSLSSELKQTTSPLPEQLQELGNRAGAVEARAGEVLGEISSTRLKAEALEKQLSTRLTDIESRTSRAGEQVGKVEDQTSLLATRTEALEKELDRRARQIEARTEELGERTAALGEREQRVNQLQRITFEAILLNLTTDVDTLDRRVQSSFYRQFSRGEAQKDVEQLNQRVTRLSAQLKDLKTDQASRFVEQLESLRRRIEEISSRVR